MYNMYTDHFGLNRDSNTYFHTGVLSEPRICAASKAKIEIIKAPINQFST